MPADLRIDEGQPEIVRESELKRRQWLGRLSGKVFKRSLNPI